MSIREWESFEGQVFPVRTPVDIIALRMEVRRVARQAGLGLVGQSSFSIATSNMAYKIGMDARPGGRVKVGQHQNGTRVGVQLMMTLPVDPGEKFEDDLSDDVSMLVDKIDIHTTPENVMVISMVKWEESSLVDHSSEEQ